jgi:hypothetical protein
MKVQVVGLPSRLRIALGFSHHLIIGAIVS